MKEQVSSRKKKEAKEMSGREENEKLSPYGRGDGTCHNKNDSYLNVGKMNSSSNRHEGQQGSRSDRSHPHHGDGVECNTKDTRQARHGIMTTKVIPDGAVEKTNNSMDIDTGKEGTRHTLDKSAVIPVPSLSESPQRSPSDYCEKPNDGNGVSHFSNEWKFLRPTKRRTAFSQNFQDDSDEGPPRTAAGQSYTHPTQSSSLASDQSSDFHFQPEMFPNSPSFTAPTSLTSHLDRHDPQYLNAEEERVTSYSSNRRPLSDSNLNQSVSREEGHRYNQLPRNTFKISENWKPTMSSAGHDDTVGKAWTADEVTLVGVVKEKLRQRRPTMPNDYTTQSFKDRKHKDRYSSSSSNFTEQDMSKATDDTIWENQLMPREDEYHDPNDVIVPPRVFESDDVIYAEGNESEVNELLITAGSEELHVDGFLEKREVDNKWNRYWCILKEGCFYNYLTSNDQTAAGSANIKGYTVNQLVDKIKGKRFVLHLSHKNYVDIFLSFDSRDEFDMWHSGLQMTLTSIPQEQDSQEEGGGLNETNSCEKMSEVKKKLLAEMLRQKMELEKMQAARKGVKKWASLDRDQGYITPTVSSLPNGASTPRSSSSTDDNIRALTRLQQRRMSTQIKLQAIKREMDDKSAGGRERKSGLHIGKKRPDLIQCHDYDPTRQTELEEQVKTLSSTLQNIDSQLSSHGLNSPRDISETTANNASLLRHSYDSSMLKYSSIIDSSNVEVKEGGSFTKDNPDRQQTNTPIKTKNKNKGKDKDINRSNSLKSSIQRFAHRTFSRTHWHKVKKSMTSNRRDSIDNKSHQEEEKAFATEGDLTGKNRDIIDITAHPDVRKSLDLSSNHFILAPPESFKSEDWQSPSSTLTTPDKPKKPRTPKERILSKLNLSNSFSSWDRLNSRLKSSASSPCLHNNNNNNNNNDINPNEQKTDLRCTTPQLESNEVTFHIPRLELGDDSDQHNSFNTNRSETDSFNTPRSARTFSRNGITKNGALERPRSGFFSARGEDNGKPHKADRNSWAFGMSPRKEVNPNVLAEIQAFEELSNKFLGS